MKYERGDGLYNGIEGRYVLIAEANFEDGVYRLTEYETKFFDVFCETREVDVRAFENASQSNDWSSVEIDSAERVANRDIRVEFDVDRWKEYDGLENYEGREGEVIMDTVNTQHPVYTIKREVEDSLADDLVKLNVHGRGMNINDSKTQSIVQVDKAIRYGLWVPMTVVEWRVGGVVKDAENNLGFG